MVYVPFSEGVLVSRRRSVWNGTLVGRVGKIGNLGPRFFRKEEMDLRRTAKMQRRLSSWGTLQTPAGGNHSENPNSSK